jgi:hypothetical protein
MIGSPIRAVPLMARVPHAQTVANNGTLLPRNCTQVGHGNRRRTCRQSYYKDRIGRSSRRLQEKNLRDTLPPSLPTQRPGLETRSNLEAHQCLNHVCRSFYSRSRVLWRLCVGRLRACRFPRFPVFQPAHSCHPFAWKRTWQLLNSRSFTMRSINPFDIWLSPLRGPRLRNAPPSTLRHGISLTGGGK